MSEYTSGNVYRKSGLKIAYLHSRFYQYRSENLILSIENSSAARFKSRQIYNVVPSDAAATSSTKETPLVLAPLFRRLSFVEIVFVGNQAHVSLSGL
jgi:hypothetical protein